MKTLANTYLEFINEVKINKLQIEINQMIKDLIKDEFHVDPESKSAISSTIYYSPNKIKGSSSVKAVAEFLEKCFNITYKIKKDEKYSTESLADFYLNISIVDTLSLQQGNIAINFDINKKIKSLDQILKK